MLKVIRILVIALTLFGPVTLRAQESPMLSLDDLVSEALQNNPQLRSARNGTAAARTKGGQVTSWDAPQIGVEFYQTPIQSFPNPWHTEAGMINSVGLQNVGVAAFITDKLSTLKQYSVPVIANVFGYAADDYSEVVRALEDAEGIAAYELNVSCPNTKHGGIFFSSDPVSLAALIRQVRRVAKRPVIVKLSPTWQASSHSRVRLKKRGRMLYRW